MPFVPADCRRKSRAMPKVWRSSCSMVNSMAEIYLLFAEGRPDIWPAGDLAVQEAVGRILRLDARPSEKRVREIGEAWRPHRGAAAIFSWHCYNMDVI